MFQGLKQQDQDKFVGSFSAEKIYRPIQYLGSKLRSLPDITSEIASLDLSSNNVFDLFSGSSVVSQALANIGLNVTAVDSQISCTTIAKTLLNVERGLKETIFIDAINEACTKQLVQLDDRWQILLDKEDNALAERDAEILLYLNEKTPLFWKNENTGWPINEPAFEIGPLFTHMQAGHYFGIRQSLEIDSLRLNIENLFKSRRISVWQYNAMLTALLSAMSASVNSAGKHFAQPLLSGSLKNNTFIKKRLLLDRKLSIVDAFKKSINSINSCLTTGTHLVFTGEVNNFLEGTTLSPGLIYADPPYTAQQYSRFYHLLETAVHYKVPDMKHKGQMTTGLYPKDRFLSSYSSKTKAPEAFQQMIERSKDLKSYLMLSYSTAAEGSNGNARMISFEELMNTAKYIYGPSKVKVKSLSHQYRQFNSSNKSNALRDSPEIIIICNP